MQPAAQHFTAKHLLEPIARARCREEPLRNAFEEFQAFTPPPQPPPVPLGGFAGERGTARGGGALQPAPPQERGAEPTPDGRCRGFEGAGGGGSEGRKGTWARAWGRWAFNSSLPFLELAPSKIAPARAATFASRRPKNGRIST